MRLIGRREQQMIDRLWQEKTGLPLLLLMESAAAAVCRICRTLLPPGPSRPGRVLVLAGKGQNGGDAFACARLLGAAGFDVACREIFPGEKLPPDAALNRQALLSMGTALGPPSDLDFSQLGDNGLIVDGLFGTGFSAGRPLPPPAAATCRQIAAARERGARVVAIDIPSGVDADTGAFAPGAVKADFTVTFVLPKIGLSASPGRFLAGKVIVDAIGVSDAMVSEALKKADLEEKRRICLQIEEPDVKAARLERPPDSHKGMFGKVLLLGGAPGMPGAILLAAEAAARSGAGLVYLGVPESIAPMVLAARPDCLLSSLPENPASPADWRVIAEKLAAGQAAVAAGPGAGAAEWLAEFLPILILQARQLVLDADALNLVAANPEPLMKLLRDRTGALGLPPAVLTPHPGEFRRLAPDIDLSDRQAAAAQLAERSGSIVVLKGASTVVAEPGGSILINPTGHEGLARGGSGDVLCGLIAGLAAQGLPPVKSAMAGAYLHGLAADLAAAGTTRRAMLPTDVINHIGEAFRQCGWEEGQDAGESSGPEDGR